MPNVIALRKTYSTLLDEAYKLASLTAVLDGPNDLAQEGANANEILIPKMSMSGLADYDKQTGYALGDVTLDYETKKCDYDRGRMFTVDAMDNIESAGIAFGRLSGEFLRTQVVPELDTWRLAKYAGYASGNNVATGAIADGKAGIAAIRAGKTAIKNAEAKTETCYLFISTTLKGMIDDLDTTASKKAMDYEFDLYTNDAVQKKLATITDDELLGSDAQVTIVMVDLFEVKSEDPNTCTARKRDWSVIPDTEGDGTDALIYKGSFKAAGEIIKGTATTTDSWQTCTFTAE